MRAPTPRHAVIGTSRMRRPAGTTLAEVLVVLVIISVSMLAAGKTLSIGIGTLQDALHEQRAAALLADITELLQGLQPTAADLDALSESAPVCMRAGSCTAIEFLASVVGQWRQRVMSRLPGAQTELDVSAQPLPNTLHIRISWRRHGGGIATRAASVALAEPA